MATSKVTPDADAVVAEIHIAAPPERVFQALVDPPQVLKWWGQQGVYRSTEFHCDLRVGGKWRTAGVSADGHNFEASGEYLACSSGAKPWTIASHFPRPKWILSDRSRARLALGGLWKHHAVPKMPSAPARGKTNPPAVRSTIACSEVGWYIRLISSLNP